jgi:hypothetical protein
LYKATTTEKVHQPLQESISRGVIRYYFKRGAIQNVRGKSWNGKAMEYFQLILIRLNSLFDQTLLQIFSS